MATAMTRRPLLSAIGAVTTAMRATPAMGGATSRGRDRRLLHRRNAGARRAGRLAAATERLRRSGSRSTALLLQRGKAAVVAVSRPCARGQPITLPLVTVSLTAGPLGAGPGGSAASTAECGNALRGPPSSRAPGSTVSTEAGVSSPVSMTVPSDEMDASAGAGAAPASLLHSCGSGNPRVGSST